MMARVQIWNKPSPHLVTSEQYAQDPDVTETDDAALVDALAAHHSERAARTLVDRHSPRLLVIVRRLLASDVMAAEDVLQQAWINAIAALGDFRRESSFSTWLTRIAIRAALDQLRRRPDLRDALPDADLAQLTSLDGDIDGRIDLDRLIAQLPSGCRGVLVLHDIEGFTHEEIADQLGISLSTVRAHLHTVYEKLHVQSRTEAVVKYLGQRPG